jgi:hypothetical protein
MKVVIGMKAPKHLSTKNGPGRPISLHQLRVPKAIQKASMSLPVAHEDQALSARDEGEETATAYRS